MSIEPFRKLVKLTARAFYDDISTKGDNLPKSSRGDNRGIGVVVLDALTRWQWVREEDLAKNLKIHLKQLRRTLRFFEEEKLVQRDHRKETAKGVKIHDAAMAATADSRHLTREGGEKIKLHTHSYCCLDYAQVYDVVRYRLHRMKKKIKDELDSNNVVQEYICLNCNKRYTALDAARLVSIDDEYFHCESCNGELVVASDKLAAQTGNVDDNAGRHRREKLKEMLQKMEEQLKPLAEQLNKIKDLPVPEFGTLQSWEARAGIAVCAAGDNSNDPSVPAQSGTSMPFLGDMKVEVLLSGVQAKEELKSETTNATLKIIPPWMIKQGMNLTKEQRGEVSKPDNVHGSSAPGGFDDKKEKVEPDAAFVEEYRRSYAAAVLKMHQQQQEAAQKLLESSSGQTSEQGSFSERQVGMKSKRKDEDKYDLECEEVVPSGNIGESYKVNDSNVQADIAVEDDSDDVEWEEG